MQVLLGELLENEQYPKIGEVVVCLVTKVLGYGAFVELLEHNNLKGFVHISQVSSGWIKNIRNFVREGQVRAARVVAISQEKNQIDLSLTKVSEQAAKARLEEWKQLKRSRKFIEVLAKENKQDPESVWEEIAVPLVNEYGSFSKALEELALEKQEAFDLVPKNWRKPLEEIVKKTVTVQEKQVSGIVSLSSNASDGVEAIKSALSEAKSPSKDISVSVSYLGSGKYSLKVSSFDFKESEKTLAVIEERVIQAIEKKGGTGKIDEAK